MAQAPAAVQPQKPLTYRQLFNTVDPSSESQKHQAIIDSYLKLRKHFEKIPEQTHLVTWPETLMEFTPSELAKAFEEGQRQEYCPTAGVLWNSAQRDRDEIRLNVWREHWRFFLKILRKHGDGLKPARYTTVPPSDDNPRGESEMRPAPVLDPAFEAALEQAFGCPLLDACRAVLLEHPAFGIMQTSEPALRAEAVEKRVREVWMRKGRP